MSERVDQVFADTMALSTAEKLVVAANLINRGKPDLAELIAERAVQELQVARLFSKTRPKAQP